MDKSGHYDMDDSFNLSGDMDSSLNSSTASLSLSQHFMSSKRHLSHGSAVQIEKRRSSSRSIKRKKFDDELVESSLIKTVPKSKSDIFPSPSEVIPLPPVHIEKKKSSKSKKSKKHKPSVSTGPNKDLGRWKAQDDLALITAVQQTCDLSAVHLGIKFSCKFTLKEIQERWYALLYDPVISKLALSAMYQLHPEVVTSIQGRTLYSKQEENILKTIPSATQVTIDLFQDLYEKHATTFHPYRTAKALYNHWLLMKQYYLLPDQTVQPLPKGDHILNFSDAEDTLNDEELKEPKDEIIDHELVLADRRQKREIRHLEEEIPKWQVMVDSVTGISPPDFDNQTLAVLRGRLVRYLMRSREITLGRAAKDNQIDVDLALEGPAWKISRKQGIIKLKNTGEFFIANEGKRPIYIDGKPVLTATKQKLNNNSVVEISGLRFIFLINQELINVIRSETSKISS